MSVRVRGGMWCDRCQRPVAAVRSTHRLGNAVSLLAFPVTAGLSALGFRHERWVCPSCGLPARPMAIRAPGFSPLEDAGVRAVTRLGLWFVRVFVALWIFAGATAIVLAISHG